ncbi:MAG: hypothetical protein ABIB61_02000 [Candidatus Shapirobacteria bacterium]
MFLKEVKRHPVDFGILVFGLIILGIAFVRFQFLPLTQEKVLILASSFYFLWGITHHLLRGDFHFKLLIEYLLISLFALSAGLLVLSQV